MLPCWGWWGRLCLFVVRMGSHPICPLAMGLAVAAWLGHAGRDVSVRMGSLVPACRMAGLVWVWQQLCADVEPMEKSRDVCRRQLGRTGC